MQLSARRVYDDLRAATKQQKRGITMADCFAPETVLAQNSTLHPLLILVGTTTVAPTKIPFVARDRFIANIGKEASVKISCLGDSFKSWLLRKEEQPIMGSTLRYGKLSRYANDHHIFEELGGKEKAEITLAELFSLMEAQKNGEGGPLLINGYVNICYIRDVVGILRAVSVDWSDGGWYVDAEAVSGPYEWRSGQQVFFRNTHFPPGIKSL